MFVAMVRMTPDGRHRAIERIGIASLNFHLNRRVANCVVVNKQLGNGLANLLPAPDALL
jgi:hypothetical protein